MYVGKDAWKDLERIDAKLLKESKISLFMCVTAQAW